MKNKEEAPETHHLIEEVIKKMAHRITDPYRYGWCESRALAKLRDDIVDAFRQIDKKAFERGLKESMMIATELWLEQRLLPGAEYPVHIYAESVQDEIMKEKQMKN